MFPPGISFVAFKMDILELPTSQDIARQQEYNIANSHYALTERGLRFLIENAETVMKRRGIATDGWTPQDWAVSYYARIGIEPIFRLLWTIIRDLLKHNIQLHEVLVEDPELFLDCLANQNLLPYYQHFPQ